MNLKITSNLRVIIQDISRSVVVSVQMNISSSIIFMIFICFLLKYTNKIARLFLAATGMNGLITWSAFAPYSIQNINPFTLKVPLESAGCYFHTFENNLRIKQKFTKYLRESCCLTLCLHFSFRYFPKNAFHRKIYPKLSGLFWPL